MPSRATRSKAGSSPNCILSSACPKLQSSAMANRILGRVSRFWDQRQTVERTNRTKNFHGASFWQNELGQAKSENEWGPGSKAIGSLSTMVSPMFGEAVAAGEGRIAGVDHMLAFLSGSRHHASVGVTAWAGFRQGRRGLPL